MKRVRKTIDGFLLYVPTWIAAFCTVFMLCVIPLYFDDAFFNINRCKVELVRAFMPVICVAMLAASVINWLRKKERYQPPYAPDGAMALFCWSASFLVLIPVFQKTLWKEHREEVLDFG